ncbi:MAG: hypothetical protein IIC73_05960, partial [Armatimonadetes bacterium]|nr:hypothetical protein [Armatimonadota bacterium]
MKAIQSKRPASKNAGIRQDGKTYTVDVHLRTLSGERWRRRKFGIGTLTEARKVRDGLFKLYNTEVLGLEEDGVRLVHGGPTVREWGEHCLTEVWPREAPRSVVHYGAKVRLYIVPALGERKLTEVSSRNVRDFIYELADRKKGDKYALSIETIRHCKATLSSMLAQAVTEEHISTNPAQVKIGWTKLDDARGTIKEDKKILSEAEVVRLIEAAKGTMLEFAVLAQARMGVRLGESLALTSDDFRDGVCRVRRQIKKRPNKKLQAEPLKTPSSRRDIKSPVSVIMALEGREGRLTTNEAGEWLDPRRASVLFEGVAKQAGV